MKKWKRYIPTLLTVVAVSHAAADFSRYEVILNRKPFGEAPPPEIVRPQINPGESFANTIRMSALLETDDGGVRIGLIDTKSNNSFFLSVGDTEEGIELVSASYDDEEAVLRKGPEMAVIKLQSGDIQPLTPEQQQERLSAPRGQRLSYAERRAARQRARQERQAPPPEPKYKGDELQHHLEEYQMEVIRQGLPPLPIPLTTEMDDQLVAEGVLPPM